MSAPDPNGWKRALRRYAALSEPTGEEQARLKARSHWPGRVLDALSPQLPDGALDRLRDRFRGESPPARRPRTRLAGVALALASAATVAAVLARPSTLDEPLDSVVIEDRTLTPDVALQYAGTGRATGSTTAPRIRWDAGTLAVDVTPGEGVDLRIETGEAEIAVIGTRFEVRRDVMGTMVAVRHGTVRVTCIGAPPNELTAGASATCLPTRAAGLLARAQALADEGAPSALVLVAVDRALTLAAPGDPVSGELVALRIATLTNAGRRHDALRAAEAYLASGAGPRRAEVEALAAALRARP